MGLLEMELKYTGVNFKNSEMKRLILCIAGTLFVVTALAQSFSINVDGSTANVSAMLDVKSTTKGMLIPRMSKTEKNAIVSPATGLLIFQNAPDSIGFHYYDGAAWVWLEVLGNAGWKTKGNAGTDTAINFIGTTNNMPLRFKQNGIYMAQWDLNKGNYYIGEGAGKTKLSTVTGNIAIGDSAFSFPITNSGTSNNIAIGFKALKSHKTYQNGNIAIGAFALENDTSNAGIFNNHAVGFKAMQQMKNGQLNCAFGTEVYDAAIFGSGNTVIGGRGLHTLNSGNDNTSLGIFTATLLTTGNGNTFIGARTGTSITTNLINATAIGYKAQVDTSNAMVLGSINGVNGATSNTNVGIGCTTPKSLLHIAATGVNAASSYYFPENNLIVEDTSFNATPGTITNAVHVIANDNDASAIIGGSKQNPLTSSIVMRNNDRSLRFVTNATNANGVTADMIIDSTGKVGIGFTNPSTSLGINGAVTYVQDNTNIANAATTTVTVGNRTFFRISSDAAPASRKLALSNGLFTGQMLIIQCIAAGVNGFRIDDADANIDIAGATLSLLVNDSITFIWDGNEWIELHRSDN